MYRPGGHDIGDTHCQTWGGIGGEAEIERKEGIRKKPERVGKGRSGKTAAKS